jgi:hypothetical protein
MPISVKVGGIWKTVSAVKVRVGGTWKTAVAYVRTGGAWKAVSQMIAAIAPLDPEDSYMTGGTKSKALTCTPEGGTAPYTYAWSADPALGSFTDATASNPTYSRSFTQVGGEEMVYPVTLTCLVTDALAETETATSTWTVTIAAG